MGGLEPDHRLEVWRSSLVYCPVGQYQCFKFDASRDGEPVKVTEEGRDVGEFRLVEHQTGCGVLDAFQWSNVGCRKAGQKHVTVVEPGDDE